MTEPLNPLPAPLQFLDPPPITILNQPPAIPTFVDGALVHQGDLNALTANIEYLYGTALGGGAEGQVPLTVLKALTPNLCTSGAAITCLWDTVLANNDGAWSNADPETVYVQTEGYYRINVQFGTVAAYSQCTLYVLINGTDVINNSVQSCNWYGNQGNLEITVPLAKTASIQVAYEQNTGSYQYSCLTYGGCRLEVEWVAPTIPPQTV